jgi:RND family efflux transporter MFP subunit
MSLPILSVGLACFVLMQASGAASRAEEPAAKAPEVTIIRPVVRQIADYHDFVGRTHAAARVDLRAHVSGYLLKASFQEGAEVKEGDVLFEIDPRPFQAELERAEAAVTVAEARMKLAKANHKRVAAALAQRAASQEDIDRAVAEQTEFEAGLRMAKAGHEVARLNMAFTRVVAPISGQIGRRLVDPGNLVTADETFLAAIVTGDPMYVYFDIDERTLVYSRRANSGEKTTIGKVPVAVGLAGEEGFPHAAQLNFVDNHVNPETGTCRSRAVLPNKDGVLVPGMFARVRLTVGEPHKALLIPEAAIMTEGGSRFVFLVNDKDEIEKRTVSMGISFDGLRAITTGLKTEDRVVTGQLAGLRPGMTVRPRQEPQPEPKPADTAGDSGAAASPPARR